MSQVVNVFVTDLGNHVIPDHVMNEAAALSPGCSHEDRRTKAYKHLREWVSDMDSMLLKELMA